jgi:hypothetical protein
LLEGESPIRVEKRYLGSFSVPFETVYSEGRIEGVFRIDTPPINFGYDHAASGMSERTQANGAMFISEDGKEQVDDGMLTKTEMAAQPNALWTLFSRLLDCVSQTSSSAIMRHPNDSLYFSGSHIHKDTQVGII